MSQRLSSCFSLIAVFILATSAQSQSESAQSQSEPARSQSEPARSQSEPARSGYGPISPASLAFGFGPSAPVGDLNQLHDVGRSLSASIEYRLSELVRLEVLSLTYDHFTLDASEISKASMGSGLDVRISGGGAGVISVGGGVQLRARPGGFSPYMAVGVGVYRTWSEDVQFTSGDSAVELAGGGETSFGYHIGAGFEALIGENAGIYADMRVRIAFTEEEATFFAPFRSGLRFYL